MTHWQKNLRFRSEEVHWSVVLPRPSGIRHPKWCRTRRSDETDECSILDLYISIRERARYLTFAYGRLFCLKLMCPRYLGIQILL